MCCYRVMGGFLVICIILFIYVARMCGVVARALLRCCYRVKGGCNVVARVFWVARASLKVLLLCNVWGCLGILLQCKSMGFFVVVVVACFIFCQVKG